MSVNLPYFFVGALFVGAASAAMLVAVTTDARDHFLQVASMDQASAKDAQP
jgi:hypothetical protein